MEPLGTLDRLFAEWRVLKDAPRSVAALVVICVVVTWGVAYCHYEGVLREKDALIQKLSAGSETGILGRFERHLTADQRAAVTRVLDGAPEPQTLLITVEDGCNECVTYGAEWEALFAPFAARGWKVATFRVRHEQFVNAPLVPSPPLLVRSESNAVVGRSLYLALRASGLTGVEYVDDLNPGPLKNQIELTIEPR